MNSKQIKECMQHRYPMLLVDQVTEIEKGKRAKGLKNISENEWFWLNEAFPEKAMPSVLIVEALAQISGVAIAEEKEANELGFLTSIERCKFRGKAVPGDQLVLEAEIIRRKSTFVKSKGRASVGGKTVCEAELMFVFSK